MIQNDSSELLHIHQSCDTSRTLLHSMGNKSLATDWSPLIRREINMLVYRKW
jgi:hypothetical protein